MVGNGADGQLEAQPELWAGVFGAGGSKFSCGPLHVATWALLRHDSWSPSKNGPNVRVEMVASWNDAQKPCKVTSTGWLK